jgi:hypothetical protein
VGGQGLTIDDFFHDADIDVDVIDRNFTSSTETLSTTTAFVVDSVRDFIRHRQRRVDDD